MRIISQEESSPEHNPEIKDEILFDYFSGLLMEKKIEFLNDQNNTLIDIFSEEIEELTDEEYKAKSLGSIFLELKSLNTKSRLDYKKKMYILQGIWPVLIRRAISFLRKKDKRDFGKWKFDFGIEDLTNYFKDFSEFEEILFGIDKFYRDHTLHVFRVYLLGVYLIKKIFPEGFKKIFVTDEEKLKKDTIKEDEKEALWCLIALCHDLGYPLQKVEKLNEQLLKILKYFGSSNFQRVSYSLPYQGLILDKHILEFISSKLNKRNSEEQETEEQETEEQETEEQETEKKKYFLTTRIKFFKKFSNAYEKLNHGVISCILLMKNLVYFKESDYKLNIQELLKEEDARQLVIHREVLRAIANHECDDIYHIYMNNFSFLLIICDEIQEWGRPFAKYRLLHFGEEDIIKIQTFNEKEIDISLKVKFGSKELEKFSSLKFIKFIKILRSAVDSELRPFSFKLSILNEKQERYEFIYDSPRKDYPYKEPEVNRYENGEKDKNYTILNTIDFTKKKMKAKNEN